MSVCAPSNYHIHRDRYEQIVRAFALRRILVLGDLMVDEYLHGAVRRISPEGPVMIVDVEAQEFKPGGAANVANNLRSLGAHVAVVGLVGADDMGELLRSELEGRRIDVSGIVTDSGRPTTRKTRVVAHHQQVLRIDREFSYAPNTAICNAMIDHAARLISRADAMIISDYRKGAISMDLAVSLRGLCAESRTPMIANPKPSSAAWLGGSLALSLNQAEAEELAGPIPVAEDELTRFGEALRDRLGVSMLVITLGPRGLCYWQQGGESKHISGHSIEVYDVAGAGDTTISALALALTGGASPEEAAFVANHAGACAVRKAGVATVTPEELIGDWNS